MTMAAEHWHIRKPAVFGRRGLVATQHYLASETGAEVLRQGGNAVDAAVAAGLALGVVEPWMSGIGGGGYMTIYRAAQDRVDVVEFGMRAPFDATAEDYPLAGGTTGAATFNWPRVVDDVNVHGALSVAVPGYVKGIAMALERFGSWAWRDAIEPACVLAEAGLPVNWYAAHLISSMARGLAMYDETRRIYLADGLPPTAGAEGAVNRLALGNLAATYRTLQSQGPQAFYRGALAESIVADLRAAGSCIRLEDLNDYTARVAEPLALNYRDAQVFVPGHLTAGPTLAAALDDLAARLSPTGQLPNANAFAAYADALLASYRHRLRHLGEGAGSTGEGAGKTSEGAGKDAREGVDPRPTHTSHLCVADAAGNVVSLTQTIMSGFGSRIMLPGSGVLMNNGMMWFDPRPGGPNSVVGGRRPLCNMCPVVARRADGAMFAVGACGGRRILASVFQLVSFLIDYGMTVDDAVHQARIDVSGTDLVTLMEHMDGDIVAQLQSRYPETRVQPNGVSGFSFALPQVVMREAGGQLSGGCFVPSPTACVAAA